MIKASELRIGNFIICGKLEMYDPTRPNKVVAIDGEWVRKTSRIDCPDLLDHVYAFMEGMKIHGIPLTEEWLLKFGFKKSDKWFTKYNFPHQVNVSLFHNKSTIGANEEYDVEIKFVHQLQNLYFALTGEELTTQS